MQVQVQEDLSPISQDTDINFRWCVADNYSKFMYCENETRNFYIVKAIFTQDVCASCITD